jgi:hypothetical protein
VILIRKLNLHKWNAATAASIATCYTDMEKHWEAAVGTYKSCGFERVKHHIPMHWEDLYEWFGTPVHWSTQHFIEALQKILKAAWRRTNGVQPSKQVMKRIELGRYISGVLLPSIGLADTPIAALREDRATGAYLTGITNRIQGSNTLFTQSILSKEQIAFNRSLKTAMTDHHQWGLCRRPWPSSRAQH